MKKLKIFGIAVMVVASLVAGTVVLINVLKEAEPENVVFAVLPDTQLYSQNMPEIFKAQTQWIADHVKEEEIDFVLHLGDIVNNPFNDEQWLNAKDAMQILDQADIPYVAAVGNHDVDYKAAFVEMNEFFDDIRSENEKFLYYYPKEIYKKMKTYGGHSSNGFNQYHFVNCGDYKIMVVVLDWLPSEGTLEWTEELLDKYSDFPTVIMKHAFIAPRKEKTLKNFSPRFSDKECQKQWEIFKGYNQIFMIINGHHSGVDHGVVKNDYGEDVFLSVVDFQSEIRGGNGWMQMMELDFETGNIAVKTFSPYVMQMEKDEMGEKDIVSLRDPYHEFDQEFDLNMRFKEIAENHS